MVEATVRYGRDTWAGEHKPAARHNGSPYLRVSDPAATSYGGYSYLYLKTPVPPGQVVTSAKLQVFVARQADWSGTKTLTLRRIADPWKAGKLNWNNKPGVSGASQPTVTVTDAKDGQLLEFDVTVHLQHISNGAFHYGWRIETDSASSHLMWGFASDYPPKLVVSFSTRPLRRPTWSPPGGSVSVDKWVCTFSATDLTNPGEISAVRVLIDPAASETAPAFDSGWMATTEPQLDLTTTSYAGLALDASTLWRTIVKNTDGDASDWSDWVPVTRTDKGTMTITNPAAAPNNYVTESTPPILATSSVALDSAEVLIVDPGDPPRSSPSPGRSTWPAAPRLLDPARWNHPRHRRLHVIVRGWDQVDRVASAGDTVYLEARQDFTFQEDTTVTPAGSLTADGSMPWVVLSWQRATAPDSWTDPA